MKKLKIAMMNFKRVWWIKRKFIHFKFNSNIKITNLYYERTPILATLNLIFRYF